MVAIETQGLSKTFTNGVEAVKNLDLTVRQGGIFGFLGPNGAGKTTTVRLLNGTLNPTSGRSSILGMDSKDETIRLRTATLAELARMYESITVFMCTHNLPLAEGICDTFGFISRGELVRTGGREDLIESTRQNVT